MKKTDFGVEHIREIRHTISEEHAHDPKRLVDHYRRIEDKYKDRFRDPAAARESSTAIETG